MKKHQYILSVAGFDPSSGAGITSDIKTFEAHGLYGLSVCTAVTVQNDIQFTECKWIEADFILKQISLLFERFEIPTVKIGIVQSWKVLKQIVFLLKELNPSITIVLDPIIKASAGYGFHTKESQDELDDIWRLCSVITPNYDEIQQLYPEKSVEKTVQHISQLTNVYLKGGHRPDKKGFDELFTNQEVFEIPPIADSIFEKHGSGCVLSSTLALYLAKGETLVNASIKTKTYVEDFLNSNKSLLGTHSRLADLNSLKSNT